MLTKDERSGLVEDVRRVALAVEAAEVQLARDVAEARQRGLSWEDIAAGLGVSKQAAHRRFRSTRVGLDDVALPL